MIITRTPTGHQVVHVCQLLSGLFCLLSQYSPGEFHDILERSATRHSVMMPVY